MELKKLLQLSIRLAVVASLFFFALDAVIVALSTSGGALPAQVLFLFLVFSASLFLLFGFLFGLIQGFAIRVVQAGSSLCTSLSRTQSPWWPPLFYALVSLPGIIYVSRRLFQGRGIAGYPVAVTVGPLVASLLLFLLVLFSARLAAAAARFREAPQRPGRRAIVLAPLSGAALLTAADASLYVGLYPYVHHALSLSAFVLVEIFLYLSCAPRWKRQKRILWLRHYLLAVLAAVGLLAAFPLWQARDDLKSLVARRTVNEAKLLALLHRAVPKDEIAETILLLQSARSREATASTPPVEWESVPGKTPAMNFVIVTVDALRADHVGCYGYGSPTTPRIDRFAGRSVLFENAYQTGNNTATSLRALFEVTLPHRMKWLTLGAKAPFLEFSRNGYRTISVNLSEMDTPYVLEFNRYFDTVMDVSPTVREGMNDAVRTDVALDAMALYRDDRFLLWVDYVAPHAPYAPPEGFDLFGDRPVDRYDGELRYADAEFGRLLDGITKLGLDRTTIIALTADHGEEFGEHGGTHHSRTLYNETIKVPLILYVPGWNSTRVPDEVGCIDLIPTLLHLAGLRPPREMDGVSLLPLMRDRGEYRRREVFSQQIADWSRGNLSAGAVIKGGWKLIYSVDDDRYELYDLHVDPGEQDNRAFEEAPTLRDLSGYMDFLRLQSLRERILDRISDPVVRDGLDSIFASHPDPKIRLFAFRILIEGCPRLRGERVSRAVKDGSVAVRRCAIKEIVSLPGNGGIEILRAALTNENDDETTGLLLESLAKMPGGITSRELREWSRHNSPAIRVKSVEALGHVGDDEAEAALLDILRESRPKQITIAAIGSLARIKSREAVPLLHELCVDTSEPLVVKSALSALGLIGDTRSFPLLTHYLLDYPEINLKREAARALGQMGDRRALEIFRRILPRANYFLKGTIWRSIGRLIERGDGPYLVDCVQGAPDDVPQRTVIGAMEQAGGEKAFIFLCRNLDYPADARTRGEAAKAALSIAKDLRWEEFIPPLSGKQRRAIERGLGKAIDASPDKDCRAALEIVRGKFRKTCSLYSH